jgi:hypothetical protein
MLLANPARLKKPKALPGRSFVNLGDPGRLDLTDELITTSVQALVPEQGNEKGKDPAKPRSWVREGC